MVYCSHQKRPTGRRRSPTKTTAKPLVLAALFLALALVLPFLTGQIPEIGTMLSPMHIPVLLSGFFCGWHWGLALGLTAPVLRSLMFGMPPMFPAAVCMSAELGTYGAVCGLLYSRLPRTRASVYLSLLAAMAAGRIVWGAARFLCSGLDPSVFGFAAFWAGSVVTALPGIVLQLLLIPVLVMTADKVRS